MFKLNKFTVKQAVCKVFERIQVGESFTGIEFKRWCVQEAPNLKDKYVETFLRLLRYTHRDEFVCINRAQSKFRRIA